MSYFEKEGSLKFIIKWLIGVIAVLFIVLILVIKSLIDVASNKVVHIQVPQFMESGQYVIGATSASPEVFKMWAKVWVQSIGTFSYTNVDKQFNDIMPFLDAQTAYKNKADIMKFLEFVKTNFITQRFNVENIKVDQVAGGYFKVTAFGTINRQVGKAEDQLNGMRYSYTFLCYVRNGHIYIQSISSAFFGLNDSNARKQLKMNQFVHFDEVLQ
ncbi:TraE/TraK family type IV conjugative transfer system protein [Campylobacter sp. MOP7]|uniref:TraE/TraK family type IV conjugative transfer system protein n=1 Tax=Campylobacter canis TaxID=3378588 RepID=UPI00387E6495